MAYGVSPTVTSITDSAPDSPADATFTNDITSEKRTPPLNVKIVGMKKWFLLVLCTAILSCRREVKRVVGVVPKGANHIFWQTVHAGAIKAGREFHFEIEWNAPTLEVDSSRQIE